MEVKIVKENGNAYIAVDGKIVDPVAFKSFRPTKNNVSDFYKAGVRIFHVFCSGLRSGLKTPYSLYGETWFGDKDYRFENLDRQIDFFIENAPDAYVFINVHLDVRPWWLQENPGRPDSFTHLSQIAADEKWRRDTADYLQALIRHTEEKYDGKVLGYFLLGGLTTEWFSGYDCESPHPIKSAAFRRYMKDENAEIPTKEELEKSKTQIFLDPQKDKKVIAYRKFHAELIADLVLYYCRAAQEVLEHKKLVGVFFGYIMELMHSFIWNYGHLALDKVNESADVDMIATPTSYHFRKYDDCGAHMILNDTLGLHNKIYFSSFDNLTFLTPTLPDDPRRICNDPETSAALNSLAKDFGRTDLLDTREKTIQGMRREMMLRLSKRCATWWFDMLEGWFYDDGLMQEIKALVESSKLLLRRNGGSNSQIAVFVSSESLYYVNKQSDINTECLCRQRGALGRIGAPYDLYSMSDLERVKLGQYKLIVFLDAFYLSDKQRGYINGRVKGEGRSLLFVGACDYVDGRSVDIARVSALTEMNVAFLQEDEKEVEAFGSTYGYEDIKTPTAFIDDKDAQSLGVFPVSGKCALARKACKDYAIFYSALGNFSHNVLREIARMAGVHIYAEHGVPVYVNSALVGVYNTQAKWTEVSLEKDGEYVELFSGKIYKTVDKKVILPTGESPAQMLIVKNI